MATGGQRRTRSERVAALELPPGGWERAWASLHRRDVLLRIGLCLVTAVVLCCAIRGWQPPFAYRAGQVLSHDLVARVRFEAHHAAKTEAAREQARRQVRYVYSHDPRPLERLIGEMQAAVGDVLAAADWDAPGARTWAEFEPPAEPESDKPDSGAKERFEKFRRALAGEKDLTAFRQGLDAALKPFRQRGILGKPALKPWQGRNDEIIVFPHGRPEAQEAVKISQVLVGPKALEASLRRELRSPEVCGPIFAWLSRRITPSFSTLAWDENETRDDLEEAVAAVANVVESHHAGDTLAEAGRPLTTDQVRLLRCEYEAVMARRPLPQMLGRALAVLVLIVALFSLCAAYLLHREPRLLVNLRQLALILALTVLTVILSKWAAADFWRAEIVPFLLFGQTVAIVYRQEMAMLLAGVAALIISLAIGHGLATLLLLLGIAVTTILQLGRVRSRSKLVHVSLSAGLVAFLLTVGLALLENQPLGPALWIVAACNGLWTVAAGFLMTGLLPFIEKLFGVLTDISLLELGDVSHPLLQQLVQRAPSTYNHSITVGSIAEAAAEAIAARGLLVRVGAYYHDIGKMLNPEYFIENQPPDENRHESLVPTMSSLVIVAHIKDGVDLARQHGLPNPIIDLIHQHHGTTLVSYFYDLAYQQSQLNPNGGEVDESQYRYPGPRPQTKEAGVLMLADSVESASRTLVDPAPARIESLVRDVAEDKLDGGQFDESGLTLRELRTIENSMIKSLIAIYHGRVKYPEQKTA